MNKTAQKIDSATLVEQSYFAAVTEAIRAEVIHLLGSGEVSAVLGYITGRRNGTAIPEIISNLDRASELIFSPACVNNLVLYLTKAKKEILKKGKVAIVAKGCDLRALAGLMAEAQLKRDELFIIGVSCAGVQGRGTPPADQLTAANMARKCRECTVREPTEVDSLAGILPQLPVLNDQEGEELARLEAMTPAERWQFWKTEFSRCVRCMACRQICPFCFCEQCLCDRNRPQAVEITPRPAGNMAWHIVRAMHLAGRCAGCAECERSCPMDIPLNLLNRKITKELKELYGHEAGLTPAEKGPLAEYMETDDQSFIK